MIKETGVEGEIILHLDEIGSLKYLHQRNTLHFSVNGEVSSHSGGSWKNRKYAVIVPFPEIPVSQLRCGRCVDTYIENGLKLPSSAIILCPKEEVEQVKANNLNVTVIGYSDQNVSGYADCMVGILEYKVEDISADTWMDSQDTVKYYEDLKKSNLTIHTAPHSFSYENTHDEVMTCLRRFESLVNRIIENDVILSYDEINALMKDKRVSLSSIGSNIFGDLELDFYVDLQRKVLKEIIPFLEERGVIISEECMLEVMRFVSLIDARYKKNNSNQDKEMANGKILELMKNSGAQSSSDYINKILFENIFNQLNSIIEENKFKNQSL